MSLLLTAGLELEEPRSDLLPATEVFSSHSLLKFHIQNPL